MTTSIRRATQEKWAIALGLIVVILMSTLIGLPLYLSYRRSVDERHITGCVAAWATQYSARADILARYGLQKDVALRLVISSQGAAYVRARQQYLAASNAYNTELRLNPPPVFRCPGFTAPIVVQRTVVSKSTAAAPSRTVTASRTVPGPTVTVPGPTVVATRTATATRTVPGPVRTVTVTRRACPVLPCLGAVP